MSIDEIIEQAIQGHASTRDAIRLAIQQEREACAKLCEEMGTEGYGTIAIGIAIRARGDASDMSKECVDETAKDQHDDIYDIWVEQKGGQ